MVTTEKCTHYWKIEPATDEQSKGECILCHAQKMFSNIIDQKQLPSCTPRKYMDDIGFIANFNYKNNV